MYRKILLIGVVLALLLVVPAMATITDQTVMSSTSAAKLKAPKGGIGVSSNAASLGTATIGVIYPYGGGPSYFPHLYVSGFPGLGPDYLGWCVDTTRVIYQYPTTYTANVYLSTDPDIPAGAVLHPENFDKVNWILNNYWVGKISPTPGLGAYTYSDIQYAIWVLISNPSTNGLYDLNYARAQEIIDAANANGHGFVPECGQFIAIVFVPVDSAQTIIAQAIVGQVPIASCTLEVTKTAAGTYDRGITWTLTKTVDGQKSESFSGLPGDSFTATWKVVADKTVTEGNYKVAGQITITNPSDWAASFTISDQLNDGPPATVAAVSCPSSKVPAKSSVTCDYTAIPAGATATQNSATVVSAGKTYTGSQGITWAPKVDGYESGTLSDVHLGYSQVISDDTTLEKPETFECPPYSEENYPHGSKTDIVINTADLDGNIGLTDQAKVSITCVVKNLELVGSASAAGTYDRTVEWTLAKSVNNAVLSGKAGTVFPTTIWTVVADKTETPGNYKVTGSVSFTNPNAFPEPYSVSVVLYDGPPATVATVDCDPITPDPQNSGIIGSGATVDCSFAAYPLTKTATKAKVTISVGDNPNIDTDASIAWTETLIGYDSGTLSDPRFSYSELISADTTETFTETFSCPMDKSKYDANGKLTWTETNLAKLNDNIDLEKSASVTITCEASFVDLLKWTDGAVNPAQSWTFNLYNGPDGFGGTVIGSGNTLGDPDGILEFGNKVLDPTKTYTVCELSVPAGWATVWKVGGTIVVPYNPNANDPVPQDLGNRCLDFGAGTPVPIPVGTLHFSVDNQHPGGAPRTPGYWKNWNTCAGTGNQAQTALKNGGWQKGFWLLDDVITKLSGIPVDGYTVTTCQNGVAILDDRQVSGCNGATTKKVASNPGNTLAKHLLTAKINLAAGACNPSVTIYNGMTLNQLIVAADNLLTKYSYNGCESKLTKGTDAKTALAYAKALDQYNNGMFCQ